MSTEPALSQPESTDEFDWNSIDVTLTEAQTRQFVTLYRALSGFDDRKVQGSTQCPRLCFAGSADVIEYGEGWGGVRVAPAQQPVGEVRSSGWSVEILEGLDHTQSM